MLEDDDPATGLLRFISESGINCLVLGSCSSNYITRYGAKTTHLISHYNLLQLFCWVIFSDEITFFGGVTVNL